MVKINHDELQEIILEAYKKKVPVFVWGPPGIGKSQVIKQTARLIAENNNLEYSENVNDINDEKKFMFIDIRISQLDPTDLRGLPRFDDGKVTWSMPKFLPDRGQGIIAFDELNLAPPSIQVAAYQLILDRRLGEYTLPENYLIVACGNRIEDRANVFELPAPLANRFCHAELNVPEIDRNNLNKGWIHWALQNKIDNRIITYLLQYPTKIFLFDGKLKEKAFPTPRSWEFCSKLIDGVTNEQLLYNLASAAVGSTGAEFVAFIKLSKEINVENIIKNPESIARLQRTDLKFAAVNALVEYWKTTKKKKEVTEKIAEIINYIEPEFGILLLHLMKSFDYDKAKEITLTKHWQNIANKFDKYL